MGKVSGSDYHHAIFCLYHKNKQFIGIYPFSDVVSDVLDGECNPLYLGYNIKTGGYYVDQVTLQSDSYSSCPFYRSWVHTEKEN